MSSLNKKNILILGGSSGMGLACAKKFAEDANNILIMSSNSEKLERAKSELASLGKSNIEIFNVDLRSPNGADKVISYVSEHWDSGVDGILLNGGGPPFTKNPLEIGEQTWIENFYALFLNHVRITQMLLPQMIKKEFGRIISISSSGVLEPIEGLIISNSLRSAMLSWVKTMSNRFAGHGITFNTVIPGKIRTNRLTAIETKQAEKNGLALHNHQDNVKSAIPAGRYGTPGDIAQVIDFLFSEKSSYITGSAIKVDGGLIKSI